MTNLVFWHGWSMAPAVWTPLTEELQKLLPAGTCLEAPALPGYEGTTLPAGDCITSWVDALMENITTKVILCGWSMGAIMALDAAKRYPEKVDRLVLFGATPSFVTHENWPHAMAGAEARAFRRSLKRDTTLTLKHFITLFNRKDVHARAIVRQLDRLPVPPVHVLDAGMDYLERADHREAVGGIHQKTLLVHGQHDPLMPVDAARWLEKNLPDATLTVVPDAAHAPFLSDAATCAKRMADFLES